MNTTRFETFAPIRKSRPARQETGFTFRKRNDRSTQQRKLQRMEKARRCGRVFA